MKRDASAGNTHMPYFTIIASVIFITGVIFSVFGHKIVFLGLAVCAICVYLFSLWYSYRKHKAWKDAQKLDQPKKREYRIRWIN